MARARSPEVTVFEAALALVRQRFGPDYVLRGVSYEVEGPDGVGQRVRLDPVAWLARQASGASEARHSADFASVSWFGTSYTFTPIQRHIVSQLWSAWEAGVPDIGGDRLVAEAGGEAREMRHIFRGHPAWQAMIVSMRQGVYRLQPPGEGTPNAPD